MLKPVFLVAFSGHRPSDSPGRSTAELEATRPLIGKAIEELRSLATERGAEIEFYSSAAEGADIVACECALDLGIPVHVILPMPDELFERQFQHSPEALDRLRAIIAGARAADQNGTFRIADGHGHTPCCYIDANVQLLESADALITVWDGESTDKEGGTARVVQQAEALRLPMIGINPVTGEVLGSRVETFADPEDPFSGLAIMNSLAKRTDRSPLAPAQTIDEILDRLDSAAMRSSAPFRRAVTLSILLHGLAALVATVSVSFAAQITQAWGGTSLVVLAATEFLLVAVALSLLLWHRRKGTQSDWLECRMGAEILRSVRSTRGLTDPLHFRIRRRMPEWYRLSLTASIAAAREDTSHRTIDELRSEYLDRRVNDQIKHFEEQLRKAHRRGGVLAAIANFAGWGAVLVVFYAVVYKLVHLDAHHGHASLIPAWTILLIFFLPVALPLLAGIAGSLRSTLDIARRRTRYRQMIRSLERSREWIENLETETQLRRAASHVEEMLLDEHIEWLAAAEAGTGH